jgi:hypothetical protein
MKLSHLSKGLVALFTFALVLLAQGQLDTDGALAPRSAC